MPAYKDSKTGTWFVKFYCKDWTGENKQIKKRGFATKREALEYERNYKIRQENNLDMTFGEFWKLYTEDVKNYVKLNTWLTKEHIVDTKMMKVHKEMRGLDRYREQPKEYKYHDPYDDWIFRQLADIDSRNNIPDTSPQLDFDETDYEDYLKEKWNRGL